jgi:hypothetical protein
VDRGALTVRAFECPVRQRARNPGDRRAADLALLDANPLEDIANLWSHRPKAAAQRFPHTRRLMYSDGVRIAKTDKLSSRRR